MFSLSCTDADQYSPFALLGFTPDFVFAAAGGSHGTKTASGDVRLVDATGAIAGTGLLQVYVDGDFGTVCGANDNAADVVCRMLGYDRGFIEPGTCSTYGGTGLCGDAGDRVAMKDLECLGGELDISRCKWSPADGACAAHELDAVVFCTQEAHHAVFAEGTLRLLSADGAPSTDGNGRLEIFHSGVWGSVCGAGLSAGSAAVACKQMGFSGGQVGAAADCSGPGGNCPLPRISELSCTGQESDLASCPFAEDDDVFCAPNEAVVLKCAGNGDTIGRPRQLQPPNFA